MPATDPAAELTVVPSTVPAAASGSAATATGGTAMTTEGEGSTGPLPTATTPALPAATGGAGAGAGSGGAGRDGAGAGAGRSDVINGARPDVEPAAGADTVVLPPVGASGGTAPATPVTATGAVAGPAATPPVAGQVARHVAVLSAAGDGSHTMTLVLNPETLGPVEVQVTVVQGSLDLQLRGAHEQGRMALLDALPELRRDLEAAGLSPSRVEVDADWGGSWLARHAAEQQAQREAQQGFTDRGSQQNQPGERSRSWGRAADSGEGRAQPSRGSTSSGVDVRV
ncbi:flagellar hook-length control protein FliK [Blastococcus atacamensis]|uniref:flagellar hook-length control protein FliK n=1 Tax=Blastococcus atacamensis TaxID=2070508 RepID=UPI000CEC26A8|nr:flagellar hook-length control protein FliK [Blastococcus atacamensis]